MILTRLAIAAASVEEIDRAFATLGPSDDDAFDTIRRALLAERVRRTGVPGVVLSDESLESRRSLYERLRPGQLFPLDLSEHLHLPFAPFGRMTGEEALAEIRRGLADPEDVEYAGPSLLEDWIAAEYWLGHVLG